jgi:transcriptional regulator with XRE-family HTH domain
MIPKEKINKYYEDYIEEISSFLEKDKTESFHLGAKIRKIREEKKLSLEDIAQKTGFDLSVLKDIEEEKIHPPLATIIKLSKALDTMVSNLISDDAEKRYCVVKAKDHTLNPRQASKFYKYMPLAHEVANRHMETFIVKLYPTEEEEFAVHEGEEFIYVLDGEVKITIDNKDIILDIGDTIYYHSTVPHFITTNTDEPALILAVIYNSN